MSDNAEIPDILHGVRFHFLRAAKVRKKPKAEALGFNVVNVELRK
jgi:hypothetical protein